MSLSHSPKIVTDGLVFMYDMGNTKKSWKGAPVTNLAKNSDQTIDWTVSNLLASVTRSTVKANEVYRITSTTGGSFRFTFNATKLINGLTYTMSFKYKFISGVSPFIYMSDWGDSTITKTTINIGEGVTYHTGTGTRSTYDATYRFMDAEISANTVVEIWDLQLEQNSYATPYTPYQRTASQSIIDYVGNNDIIASSLTYNADGSFSFNAAGNYLSLPTAIGYTTTVSAFAWIKITGTARGGYHIVFGPSSLEISIPASTGDIRTGIDTSNGRFVSNHGSGLLNGNWHYVGFTFDGTTKKSYIDGTFVGSQSITGILSANISNRAMGKYGQSDVTYGMNGYIASAQIYKTALSAQEIRTNFNALRGRFGI